MTTGLFTSLPGLAVRPAKTDPQPLVIYHDKCPDGFGAALAAWLYFDGRGEYLGVSHGKITTLDDLPPLEGRAVYILDFSFEEGLMQGIDERAAKLVLLDHHQSAADRLGRFQCRCGAVHFDMSQSGAMLSWKFFFPEQSAPDLIRYVQDRDLWTWAFPDSAAFLSALDLEPNDFPRWAEIAAFSPAQVADFAQRGKAMNEKFLSLCADIAQCASPLTFNGHAGLMVNCPGAFTSEVGNMLSAACGSFALLWSVSKDGTVKVGLRAVPTFNAIPLAESMGGGGHPQACGFRMGPERLAELLTGVFVAEPAHMTPDLFTMTDDKPADRMTVLVVDDTKENLTVIGQLLRPYYQVRVASSGPRALQAVEVAPQPDLILLDVMMPDMDGYQVLQALRSQPQFRDIPVIFVTALAADTDEELGLSLGAVDYVTKPVKPALLLARVKAQLELKKARDWLANQNIYLDSEVRRRMAENELIKDVSLHALAALAEKRDNETGNHLHRTQGYIALLMDLLRHHPRFQAQLADEAYCARVIKAAPLHDIGKVGIPDAILLKPGKLTADEFEVMKTHAMIGADALGESMELVCAGRDIALAGGGEDVSGSALDFLQVARQIAGGHHEKWDGSGYPLGLKGDEIPLAARLMAVADVFDALISRRHYKEPFPDEKVLSIIREGAGKHFDPDVAAAFLTHVDEFKAIAVRYQDAPSHDATTEGKKGA